MCRGSVKVFSRVYQVLGVLISYGLGGKRGGPQPYIYISVLVGFPVVFSTLVGVVLVTWLRKKYSFWQQNCKYFCKVIVVVVVYTKTRL